MPETKVQTSAETTRDSVLEAASIVFLSQPYDKATLRRIAQEAVVHVAYVHRLFGSKKALFREVLSNIFDRLTQTSAPMGSLLDRLVEMTHKDVHAPMKGGDAVGLFIHSLSNPEAREIMVEFLRLHVLIPLEAGFDGPDATAKAEKVFAFLVGVRITGRFIGLKSVGGQTSDEWKEWLVSTIRCIYDN